MGRRAFLTPDTLAGDPVCFPLYIPGHLFHYVVGALGELTEAYNWESFGSVTTVAAAQFFDEALLALVSNDCPGGEEVFSRYGERSSDQTAIANNTNVPILWDFSTGSTAYFTINLTTGVISILQPGRYICTFNVTFAANSTGVRRLRAIWDNNESAVQQQATTVGVTAMDHTFPIYIPSGTADLTLQAFQNSGGTLDLQLTSGTFGPARFLITRVS